MRLYGSSHGKVDFFSIVTAPGLCALTTRADGRARYEAETYETTPGLLKSMGRELGLTYNPPGGPGRGNYPGATARHDRQPGQEEKRQEGQERPRREPGQAEAATLTRKKGRVRQVSERAGGSKRRVAELSGIGNPCRATTGSVQSLA